MSVQLVMGPDTKSETGIDLIFPPCRSQLQHRSDASQAAALSSFRAYFRNYGGGYCHIRKTERSKDGSSLPVSDELIWRDQVRVNRTWRYREQDSFSD